MKIVHYESNAPWVGKMKCPNPKCGRETPAWQSSGMSGSCPHFFCDTCSNVIHREQDHALLYEHEANQELLEQIAATLPNCPCGGRFVPGANPKCPSCKTEYTHQWDAVKRLNVPFMPILDGSCLIRDRLYSYEVCIGSKPKYWWRLFANALTSLGKGRS